LLFFLPSLLVTFTAILWLGFGVGWTAVMTAIVLIVIEIMFSFDNAIINAKTLAHMSPAWQRVFMTFGILIAVVGTRFVLPILVVMVAAHMSWGQVVGLALNNPKEYAHHLESAHASILAFGGMFLLMLALHFFFDSSRRVVWIGGFERRMQSVGRWWSHAATCVVALGVIVAIPGVHDSGTLVIAGLVGIATYLLIHGFTVWCETLYSTDGDATSNVKKGWAGFASFIYLEVLDTSFSFDGVIGAFAITTDVVLIAIGLGIGAYWVRSLTIYAVRHKTLEAYRYLEHGAHYTIAMLALTMLVGLFVDIPEAVSGALGLVVIAASVASSVRAERRRVAHSDTEPVGVG
jgi:hypothetical protein